MGANLDGEEAVVAVLAEKLEESGDVGVALADDTDGCLVVAGLRSAHVLDVDVGDERPEDVEGVLGSLVDAGATVVVIEHDLDLIRNADYVIDMGPGGGAAGGSVVCAGTPAQVAACGGSVTGRYL